MIKQSNKSDQVSELLNNSENYLKYAGFAVAGLASIFLLGYVFRLFAGTIRGYKELQNAIRL